MIKSNLTDVPETMLWTLHNRGSEALREDGIIKDIRAAEIYSAIDYDYTKSFGEAEPSHAIRSLRFDQEIRRFLEKCPEGYIINLGEGLETQRYRIQENKATWITVDVPDAIRIREQFIKPDQRHRHLPFSATDPKWMEQVPKDVPVFITAQGLFMYFNEAEVRSLIQRIFSTFKEGYLAFDTIPVWLSKKTLSKKGWQKTKYYTTPRMPWGIDRHNMESTLRSWSDRITSVDEICYVKDFPRGTAKWIFPLILFTPVLNRYIPTAIKVGFQRESAATN